MSRTVAETVLVDDIEIAYTYAGDGPPVVFVHGLAEDRHSWAHQLEHLDGVRRIAYDVRGHGNTTAGSGEGTLDQLGNDLAGFLEAVTGPATCVGFSLGGTIVLWAAARRAELIKRAVVLGTSSVVGRVAATFYSQRIDLVRTGDREAIQSALRDDTMAALVSAGADIEAISGQRLAAIGDGAGYMNAASAMARLHEEPLTPLLARVRCHVDVVGGEDDRFCPRKAADILVAALSDSSYHELRGVGHLMNVDDPERVTALLHKILPREEQS